MKVNGAASERALAAPFEQGLAGLPAGCAYRRSMGR
jgi:hypothetical protein